MPAENASGEFTVFVSYAHEDNESPEPSKRWLNRLLQHLRPLVFQKLVRLWSDSAIQPGERWQEAIDRELHGARVAVLMVSPAFLDSEYIRDRELPVLLLKAQKRGVKVLPIIVRPSLFASVKFKYPDPVRGPEELTLSTFQAVNSPDRPLNEMPEHEQDRLFVSVAEQVIEIMRQDSAGPSDDAAGDGGGVSNDRLPFSNVPYPPNPYFTGRTDVLDRLHSALVATGKAALSGLGGVGKTQTAAEYAHRHRGGYGAVLWARAETEDALKADFAAIAAGLGLPEKDEADRDRVVAAVWRRLEAQTGWLLILDNADDLTLVSGVLRRAWGGHVLLTTRAHATDAVARIEITEMPPAEGTLFLLRRAKIVEPGAGVEAVSESDREMAAEIVREVGGLPLALDQAGAFIENSPSSLAEYLELYRKEGAELRATHTGLIAQHQPVTITFSLAFRQVEQAGAASADLLRACAFMAPDAIPEEIFVGGAAEMGENLSPLAGGGVGLVKTLGAAARFSLIRRNPRNKTVEMHRVVQQVLRDEMDEETRHLWAERTVRALNEAYPEIKHENWPLCEKLLPHAIEAARLIEKYDFEFYEAARLLNQAGYYCFERAQYAEAGSLFAWALGISERVLGPERPDMATSLNNLASLYKSQGKYAEAEPLYLRALDIRKRVLGPEHPDVAMSLNNLASLYHIQGRHAEAEPLFMRALGIFEKVLGPEHPDVALNLNNLAYLYDSQGKYAEAEPLYVQALDIRERVLGPEHPDVAGSLNNLASLYEIQGKYAEAEPLYLRALGIFERVLGQEHPYVALNLNNLARSEERRVGKECRSRWSPYH